ncbi:uncharacterized protein Tco025E_05880 [Trypanosoma conorhini]|uniref:Uncharacterized protein n=1 Tax=Trypanosoma conorhini TaxID=83891 RepID=A0A422PAP2_9TRYP|nr:uncharacterized protein Tco025E_05880 [Trypanosoma conorhini]RNF14785.1 hypothetical protein Tco025E_05880 [Trypanosoma conorhini]
MALPSCQPLCPVLLDIGSSRAVTLPCFLQVVRPSLLVEVGRILSRQRAPHLPLRHSPADLAASLEPWIRPCGFSTEQPLLQDESWNMPWQAYLSALRQRGQMTSAAAAADASMKRREPDALPLVGTLALPVPICAPSTTADGAKAAPMMMEFFRVDAFIPVHVQMCHVLRRLLDPQRPCGAVAVGVVAPAHRADYFIDAARRLRAGAAGGCVPPVLVYGPGGLRFQSP